MRRLAYWAMIVGLLVALIGALYVGAIIAENFGIDVTLP